MAGRVVLQRQGARRQACEGRNGMRVGFFRWPEAAAAPEDRFGGLIRVGCNGKGVKTLPNCRDVVHPPGDERHDRSGVCAQAVAHKPGTGAFRHRRRAVPTAMTRPSTSCAASCVDRLRGGSTLGHNRSVGRDRHRRAAGRRAGHRHHLLPGRPRRVLQVHDRPAEAPAAARTSGLRRRRRRDRAGRDPRTAGLRRRRIYSPRTAPRWACRA